MLKLSDIFRINGIAFFIIIVQNSFDQKGLPLPTKKRGHILSTISLILKKGSFFQFLHKNASVTCRSSFDVSFFSMASKINVYKSCLELFSFTPGLGSCRFYWCGFHFKKSWNICLMWMLCTNSLAHEFLYILWSTKDFTHADSQTQKHTSQEPVVTEWICALKFTCFDQTKLKTHIGTGGCRIEIAHRSTYLQWLLMSAFFLWLDFMKRLPARLWSLFHPIWG